MSVAFSAKLSMLRKEKDLTQRQAAADLGISQALLSHYENGIRECSLAFAEKAARYYGVSADYLLGLTERTERTDALFWSGTTDGDGTLSTQTLLRALYALSAAAEDNGTQAESLFLNYFSLAVKKYADRLRMDPPHADRLCELGEDVLLRTGSSGALPGENAYPAALRTLETHADALLGNLIPPLL